MTEDEQSELIRLRDVLKAISDHGRALEAFEIIQAQQTEIEKLKRHIDFLEKSVGNDG